MIFLYPHGNGSFWEDNELLISLSLLQKHCKEKFTVYVVGSAPKIKGCFNYIENNPIGSRYQKSMGNLLKGAEIINAPFILMNDDFFCIKDFNTIDLCYDKTIKERSFAAKSHFYKEVLTNSIEKDSDLNFAIHYPMPVNDIELFKECCKIAIARKASVRNIYGNKSSELKKQVHDLKLKSISQVDECFYKREWFSIGDEFLDKKGKEWLTESVTKGFINVSL